MLFRFNRFFAPLLLLFLSACTHSGTRYNYTHLEGPRYAQIQAIPRTQPARSFRIISYNIRYGHKIDQAIKILKAYPELQGADVICLQEMGLEGVQKIVQQLQWNYVYYPAIQHPVLKKEFGNAILSRWPIKSDKKIILPMRDPHQLQRIAVLATLTVNDKDITVINVHKEVFLRPEARREQVQAIINGIPPYSHHCVIAGDFNTFSARAYQAVTQTFAEAEFHHASQQAGWTYRHWYLFNKKTTLDHIFSKNMKIVKAGKILNRSASDHVPIWAELAFTENSNIAQETSASTTRLSFLP